MDDFEQFYATTQRRLLRSVVALTTDLQQAQDCVQEAYLRAASRWEKVRGLDSPEAWVRRVAMNLAYDGHRSARVRRLFALRERPAGPAPGPDGQSLDVVRAVRLLPRAQQEVVVLHHLLDMSVAQVALELGRPENTVKTQLARARAALAELLPLNDEVTAHD